MTKQQKSILRAVRENDGHYTVEEIIGLAKKECPGIAVATVYNNLNALVESHEIKRISRVGKPDVYDKSTRPHEHLICTCCGRIFDLELLSVRAALADCLGHEPDDYELTVRAKCEECLASEKRLPTD